MDGGLPRLERQYQPEHGADAAWIFAGQIAAVGAGVAAGDRQPESGAPGRSPDHDQVVPGVRKSALDRPAARRDPESQMSAIAS